MAESGKQHPEDQHGQEQEERPEAKGGAGPEGTIPATGDGVAAGSAGEASNFEPEEDTDAAGDGGS
ncbi:hypothetical protein H9639_09435 [Arthrobacter sp. Sa2CUA1]|uniref:Uncharacterized protein n=1 Tax=Arthrobacter gallicola TaxID=2762225 RepID=A0ABR8USF7_9MICC|nr:hypothetical protein [Arthrobacter gallicola]MBD7995517.1 hypothetical protein [Arthrobacter gallicola]